MPKHPPPTPQAERQKKNKFNPIFKGRCRSDYPNTPGYDHYACKRIYGKQPAKLLRRIRRIYRRPGRNKRIQGRMEREGKINGIL